jgi:hypothetical protein
VGLRNRSNDGQAQARPTLVDARRNEAPKELRANMPRHVPRVPHAYLDSRLSAFDQDFHGFGSMPMDQSIVDQVGDGAG